MKNIALPPTTYCTLPTWTLVRMASSLPQLPYLLCRWFEWLHCPNSTYLTFTFLIKETNPSQKLGSSSCNLVLIDSQTCRASFNSSNAWKKMAGTLQTLVRQELIWFGRFLKLLQFQHNINAVLDRVLFHYHISMKPATLHQSLCQHLKVKYDKSEITWSDHSSCTEIELFPSSSPLSLSSAVWGPWSHL